MTCNISEKDSISFCVILPLYGIWTMKVFKWSNWWMEQLGMTVSKWQEGSSRSKLDGVVWIASPSGCRLGHPLATPTVTPTITRSDNKQMVTRKIEEIMDFLVWCFCLKGDPLSFLSIFKHINYVGSWWCYSEMEWCRLLNYSSISIIL